MLKLSRYQIRELYSLYLLWDKLEHLDSTYNADQYFTFSQLYVLRLFPFKASVTIIIIIIIVVAIVIIIVVVAIVIAVVQY